MIVIPSVSFYAVYGGLRLEQDKRKMNNISNAWLETDQNVFVETVYCELNNKYVLGYTFDGTEYQVYVIAPSNYAGNHSVTSCHLYNDGRICLSSLPGSGWHDIEGARARAVLWCTAFSLFLETGSFHFNP